MQISQGRRCKESRATPSQIMFQRFCLLCLVLSGRRVIGRLPVDVLPVNTFQDYGDRVVTRFSGVHAVVFVNRSFYVLSKNQVSLLSVTAEDGIAQHKISEVITWPSTTSADNLCRVKTRDADACNNYIRMFASKDATGRSFIVCGTHSFDPKCRIYSKRGDLLIKDARNGEFSGKSICPYDPKQTGASLYAEGDIYAATFEDFLGQKPVVYRHAVSSRSENIERKKRDETWLLDPWFVKFVDAGLKVYIFFKETAIEDNSGLTYSRVGQICKSDNGGDHILRRQFTSYAKARLNCSFPGDPPFYFDELAAATDFYELPGQPGRKVLFAAMNTPKNSIWGSAVCAYVERDIESTFRKSFSQHHTGDEGVTYWSEKPGDSAVIEALDKCQFDQSGKSVLSDEKLQFVRDHPLKSHAVPAWSKDGTGVPLFTKLSARYRFTAISIDPEAGSNRQYFVLILGTSDGKILKIIPPLSGSAKETHFVAETEVYDEAKCGEAGEDGRHVRDIQIDKAAGFIIAAFSSCVVSIPLCPVTSACKRACIGARDPYCAWDGVKCIEVLRPEGLEQDVLNGDVAGLRHCEIAPDTDGSKVGEGVAGEGGKTASADNTTTAFLPNITAPNVIAVGDLSTAVAAVALKSSISSDIIVPAATGLVIGIFICLLVLAIYGACRRRSSAKSAAKRMSFAVGTPAGERDSLYEEKRNSTHSQRPVSNHTQRQHSKRSNSSVEEDAFLDNGSEGTANSIDKARRKREKSTNRQSSASSYRRENSTEKPGRPVSVNRQTSRESNPESKPRDPAATNGHEKMFAAADYGQPQPPSPQNPGMHRTFSGSHSRPDGMPPRQAGRELRRQLSLQMPNNANSAHMPKYQHHHHSLTPMHYGTQNPLELHAQQQQKFLQQQGPPPGAFDAALPQGWHPSPAKNPHGLPRQYQTTSLDRKTRKAGGGMAHAVPHDGQQPRSYADTLPMDDPKGPGRRRYPSEPGVIGNRAPPLSMFSSKHPMYQSIEEEASPLPEQYSPTKFPPTMTPMTVGRARPNHLPIGGSTEQPSQYVIPYSNPGTPMTEQVPRFITSPMLNAGTAFPPQLRKQFSEVAVRSPYVVVAQHPQGLPHQQSAPTMTAYSPGDKLTKSNPATPEWDGNHNNFFSASVEPTEARSRNPSGKVVTPSSPSKGFPGFGHPDVVPMTTTRAQPDTNHRIANEPRESTA